MLDALRRLGGRKPTAAEDEAQAVLAEMRQEREALTMLLGRLKKESPQVQETASLLSRVEAQMAQVTGRLDDVSGRVGTVESAARAAESIGAEVRSLMLAVRDAQQSADRLTSPDGEMQKQRQVVQQLAAQTLQARATLDLIVTERASLDTLRGSLQASQAELIASREKTASAIAEVEATRAAANEAAKDHERIREFARQAREDAETAAATVRDVDQKLVNFSKLQDLARALDERLAALNATTEHVNQKAKILENQKHSIERAIVESHRLSEMVSAMDAQVARLNDGGQRAAHVEETVERVERLVRESGQQLDHAERMRDTVAADLTKLDKDREGLIEFVRKYEERLAAERRELDASQTRVADVQASVARLERAQESLAVRERDVTALDERVAAMTQQLDGFDARTREVAPKVDALHTLRDELGRVDEMARRTTWQMESLKGARQDLEELRTDIQAFYRDQTEAAQLRDRLTADRTALETFVDRIGAFSAQMPELDARMRAITGQLSTVDAGAEKASHLMAIAEDLERHMLRLAGQQPFVERLDARLDALNSLTAEVDRKLHEQIERRAEVDALRTLCDSLNIQITDARQKIDGIGQAQTRLAPLVQQISVLETDVDHARDGLKQALRDQSELTAQERQIAGMLEQLRSLSGETAERLGQIEGLAASLSRSEISKEALGRELTLVQGRQREVAGYISAAEAQVRDLDGSFRQLEQRRDQLLFAEKRIGAFEERIEDLKALTETVERRIRDLSSREETVLAIRREVEGVREISARSKADLAHLEAHRDDVVALRGRVDELLATARAADERIIDIESRRRVVDEVHLKVNVITNMLDDIRVDLETVAEQKAVLDHTLSNLARLSDLVNDAQSALRALQSERELAQRIERSITSLRSRTTLTEDKRRA